MVQGRLVVDENFSRIAKEKADDEKRKVQANRIEVINRQITRPLPLNKLHKKKVCRSVLRVNSRLSNQTLVVVMLLVLSCVILIGSEVLN